MTRFGPGEEPIYDDDGNVVVAVAYTPSGSDNVEEFWSDQRLAELNAADEAARRLAPSLVGLTAGESQKLVDQHAGLSVAFRYPGRPYQAIGAFGQVEALVVDGIVTEAR